MRGRHKEKGNMRLVKEACDQFNKKQEEFGVIKKSVESIESQEGTYSSLFLTIAFLLNLVRVFAVAILSAGMLAEGMAMAFGFLSGAVGARVVIISLEPPLPTVSSGANGTERKLANLCSAGRSPGLAPDRGLPSRHLSMPLVRSYRTFAPLPDPPQGPSAVCFCGTLLTVSRTGRYPAGLAIGEPGLSSTGSPCPSRTSTESDSAAAFEAHMAGRDHLTCFPS